jgi:hypothetical protein
MGMPVEVTDEKFKITFTRNIENLQINAIQLIAQQQASFACVSAPLEPVFNSCSAGECARVNVPGGFGRTGSVRSPGGLDSIYL